MFIFIILLGKTFYTSFKNMYINSECTVCIRVQVSSILKFQHLYVLRVSLMFTVYMSQTLY